MNPNVNLASLRMRELFNIKPPEFHGSEVKKDPNEFIDEMCGTFYIMEVTLVEKAKLVAYKFKGYPKYCMVNRKG